MPVDNRRIAGPELTQPVVIGGEKHGHKPLVYTEMFTIIYQLSEVVNSKLVIADQ